MTRDMARKKRFQSLCVAFYYGEDYYVGEGLSVKEAFQVIAKNTLKSEEDEEMKTSISPLLHHIYPKPYAEV
ncbi:hypothetical protein C5167_042790 [Papaver somniferum]|uniref:Uncharacterized protein n=1 Tax=Papaver somniferum TaxID=3469 RepID=A0A4Y7L5J8_PAPSO|nr:hypothetical protein C5167_042790 [Papaver somniferum]